MKILLMLFGSLPYISATLVGDTAKAAIGTSVSGFEPASALTFNFGQKSVSLGAAFSINDVSGLYPSNFKWNIPPSDPNAYYTLIMIDPDAPYGNSYGASYNYNYLHWIVENFQYDSGPFSGNQTVSYNGPNPPSGTGQHRYLILIYKHADGYRKSTTKIQDSQRDGFNLRHFLQDRHFGTMSSANTQFTSSQVVAATVFTVQSP